MDLSLEYRSVVASTYELYRVIEMSSGLEQTVFMYTMFNVMDNILNYPYSDDQRILYLTRYKAKLFRLDTT